MDARARSGSDAAAIAVVAALFAARYHAFLAGGVLYFRDAGFFFVPWRTLFTRLASQGFPFWNDWISSGRAYAADPNAAVFWPLTPLLFIASPTILAMANTLLALLLFFVALRMLSLSPGSAAAGCVVLLFSGVFQTLPVFFGLSAAASVPIAVVAFSRFDPRGPGAWREVALAGAALGLSFLGGEPVVTGMGGAACAGIILAKTSGDLRRGAGRLAALRAGAAVLAFLLAGGIAAVQLLPAAGELARSSRGQEMKAEHGSLFWSVRPARVLSLLEPRLTGDPLAEDPADYWGAGTFDAGNPYFYDLALGLVPLALVAVSVADRRGRGALGLALGAALLSFGRFFPLSDFLERRLTIFRYPEKWWMLATFALAAAAAVGVERLTEAEAESKEVGNAWKRLRTCSLSLGVPLLFASFIAWVSPELLRKGIWSLGLGAGDASAARVAQALLSPFIAGCSSLVVVALLSFLVFRGRVQPLLACALIGLVFLADGARRVAGSCPAGPADLYRRESPAVALVRGEMSRGRFYDDGADLPEVAARRTRDAGGLDPLRPVAGVLFGIRYAGENDIDRMTSAASARWVAETARLPWGEEKVARLRMAGVGVVRTHAAAPDPAGIVALGSSGGDRILRIDGTRPSFALLPKEPGAAGALVVVFDRPNEARVELEVPQAGAVLAMTRTFDPNWTGTLDGTTAFQIYRAGGFLSAASLPKGKHTIELRYRNSLYVWGAALSAGSLLVTLACFFARAERRERT